MNISRTLVLSASLALCPLLASAQTIDRASAAPMVTAINAERARFSLAPLAADPRLDALAEAHSMDMVRSRFFSHDSPNTGRPSDRVSRSGLRWSTVAENISINQSPEAAQQALLRSPGHHENMVDPAQRSVGIGIVRHGEQVWVTQLFAALNDSPAAATPTPSQVAPSPATPTAPEAEADEEADEEAGEEQECDAPSAPVAPAAPAAPVAPAAPAAPSLPGFSGVPMQGIPGLEQFLTGLGLTRQPSTPGADRSSPSPQVYTVQTPFGPVRVEVPSSVASPSVASPSVASPAVPSRQRSVRPAPTTRAPHRRATQPSRGRVVQVDTLDV